MNDLNLSELSDALESIRKSKYPNISQEIINSILKIEYEFQDSRTEAYDQVLKTVRKHLETGTDL